MLRARSSSWSVSETSLQQHRLVVTVNGLGKCAPLRSSAVGTDENTQAVLVASEQNTENG